VARAFDVSLLCASMWLGSATVWPPAAGAGESGDGAVLAARVPAAWGGPQGWPFVRAARTLDELRRSLPAGVDSTQGQPIEMGGDRVLRFIYSDRFEEAWFAEDAAIDGASCVRWEAGGRALHLEGRGPGRRRVSLTYHFTAPYDARELVADARGAIRGGHADSVELAMSTDGCEFIHPARACGRLEGNAFRLMSAASYQFDRSSFWIRVAAELAPGARVTLHEFTANCRVKPPGRPEVTLAPDPAGALRYADPLASSRLLHLAEVLNAQALEWRRGAALVFGRQDGPTEVAIRQRFVAPAGLRAVVVRVRHAVNPRAAGSANSLGLSVDGATVLASRTASAAQGGFAGVTELRLDGTAALADARQFFLHITLASGAAAPGAPTNVLSVIEVTAQPAELVVRTAAAEAPASSRP